MSQPPVDVGPPLPMGELRTEDRPPGISIRDWAIIVRRVNDWEDACARLHLAWLACDELREKNDLLSDRLDTEKGYHEETKAYRQHAEALLREANEKLAAIKARS